VTIAASATPTPIGAFGKLIALDVSQRIDCLLHHHPKAFDRALTLAASQGLPPPGPTERDLLQALADNLSAAPGATHSLEGGKILGSYLGGREQVSVTTDWSIIWEALTSPREQGTTTWLAELAWSVACENRDGWGLAENCDAIERAERAFNALLRRCFEPTRSFLCRRYNQVDDKILGECLNRAWAQVYRSHWAKDASQRFLGLGTIRNLVLTVTITRVQPQLCRGRGVGEVRAQPNAPVMPSWDKLPAPGVFGEFMRRQRREPELMASLLELPIREAISSYGYHVHGLNQKQLCHAFRCPSPALRLMLLRGWDRLAQSDRLRQLADARLSWDSNADTFGVA